MTGALAARWLLLADAGGNDRSSCFSPPSRGEWARRQRASAPPGARRILFWRYCRDVVFAVFKVIISKILFIDDLLMPFRMYESKTGKL